MRFTTREDTETLIACLRAAMAEFGGVAQHVLFDNAKSVVIDRDAYGEGLHRWNKALLGLADAKAKVFDIAIQTGAIFAVIIVYWQKIRDTVVQLPHQAQARRFAINVAIAFFPAVVLGLLFGKAIKAHLFTCLLYTSPSPRDRTRTRMPSSALKKKKNRISIMLLLLAASIK